MANLRAILITGAAGLGVTTVCCFTPLLVLALGAAGLAGSIAWLDYALIPAMATFAVMTTTAALVLLKRKIARRAGDA